MKKFINQYFIVFLIYYFYKHYLSLRSIKLRLSKKEVFDKKYLNNFEELKLKGYTKIPGYFSNSIIEKLNNCFKPELDQMDDAILNAKSEQLIFYDDNRKMIKKEFGYSRIYDLEHYYPDFEKIRLDTNILGFANAYYGMKCFSYHALVQKTTPVLGGGQSWHYDDFEPRFKIIIYLEDVEIENGPFSYIEGSNKLSLKKLKKFFRMRKGEFYKEQYFENDEIDLTKAKYLTAKAGDLLLVDANGIHRGLKIEKGFERYAIFSFYSPYRQIYKAKN